jgi:excisionase family DNA binding protein
LTDLKLRADDLLTAEEVARMLRVKLSTVEYWARPSVGRIPVQKVGGRNRFRRGDLEKWLATRNRRATA